MRLGPLGPLLLCLGALACSGAGQFEGVAGSAGGGKAKKGDEAARDASGSGGGGDGDAPIQIDDHEDLKADAPVMVSGAFLTCAPNHEDLPATARADGVDTYACGIVDDAARKRATIKVNAVNVKTVDGKTLTPPWTDIESDRWHGYFQIAKGVASYVDEVTLQATDETGATVSFEAGSDKKESCTEESGTFSFAGLHAAIMDAEMEQWASNGLPARQLFEDVPLAGATVKLLSVSGKTNVKISKKDGTPDRDFDMACPRNWLIHLRGADGRVMLDAGTPFPAGAWENPQRLPYANVTAWLGYRDKRDTYNDNEGIREPKPGSETEGCSFRFEVTRRICTRTE